ncbi:hypothetical protein ACIQCR_22525 [Streptomyces sp. NPDC093249]|uniref:hypothetical protein n=1 Tax=unclassified Streptomyces TaxID=2593676 RepID=UPI0038012143
MSLSCRVSVPSSRHQGSVPDVRPSVVSEAPAPGAWTAVPVPVLPDDTPRGPRDRGEPVRRPLGTGVTEP